MYNIWVYKSQSDSNNNHRQNKKPTHSIHETSVPSQNTQRRRHKTTIPIIPMIFEQDVNDLSDLDVPYLKLSGSNSNTYFLVTYTGDILLVLIIVYCVSDSLKLSYYTYLFRHLPS